MANEYPELMQQGDLFVDESGMTSMEPEGTGPDHQPVHGSGWRPAPRIPRFDRWEGETDPSPAMERGPRPVEGDGDGAPD